MEVSIFFGGSVVAAIVAGMIALFAPCCISFMLPAYFASAFQNRRILIAMTFLFAAGVATIILPIALGASLLRQLLTTLHPAVYVTGGLVMLGLAAYLLLGGTLYLPMPGRRVGGSGSKRAGPMSVYALGVFSGITSSCCAPVLAGVIALSSVASSFGLALLLGTAYVFGMVMPLFVISLLWERAEWKARGLFRPRFVTWRLGAFQRTLSVTNLASGTLLALLGVGMIWVGLTYDGMSIKPGWQANLAVWLQHVGRALTGGLAWIPNALGAVILVGMLLVLARLALRRPREHAGEATRDGDNGGNESGGVAATPQSEGEREERHEPQQVQY